MMSLKEVFALVYFVFFVGIMLSPENSVFTTILVIVGVSAMFLIQGWACWVLFNWITRISGDNQ